MKFNNAKTQLFANYVKTGHNNKNHDGNASSDNFKVYMKDTGLLMAMLEDGSQEDIMDGNLGIYKGAIYENIIADIFSKSGKNYIILNIGHN